VNPFDGLADTVFSATAAVMGYDARWTPQAGGAQLTARVHYANRTEAGEVGNRDYRPEGAYMEYQSGSFPGLKEAIDEANGGEEVFIMFTAGEQKFFTTHAETLYDGRTVKVGLQPIPS
jgi:hypothetical protein